MPFPVKTTPPRKAFQNVEEAGGIPFLPPFDATEKLQEQKIFMRVLAKNADHSWDVSSGAFRRGGVGNFQKE